MRPVPRPRHVLAVLILIGVAAAYASIAVVDPRLSHTQVDIATAALKDHRPDLYVHDPVFGTRLWRFHTPVFLGMLEFTLVPAGYDDLTLPFRIYTGIVSLVYLLGMYGLLYRQCRSWSVAAFVSVLSSAVVYTVGRTFWGVGSLASISPPTLVLAAVPTIALTFLHYGDPAMPPQRQWRLLWVFGFVGLLGNLHLVSAINLTIVLAIVHVGRRRFALQAWGLSLTGALCAVVAALPYAAYYVAMRQGASPGGETMGYAQAVEAFRMGELAVVYPDIVKGIVNWLIVIGVLLIPAVAVLPRIERFRVRNLSFWAWFLLAGLFVAFGLQGASQLIGFLRGKAPPVIDFVQASSLIMLPLYVLFAQALTNLFRLVRTHPRLVQWTCAALMVAWMLPSDNLRVVRHAAMRTATMFLEESDRPRSVQRHLEADRRREELRHLTDWARTKTDPSAMFLVDSIEFRMLAHRAVLASETDVRYTYYLAPWRLQDWVKLLERQQALLRPTLADVPRSEALREFVAELAAREDFNGVREWYAVFRAADAPTQGEVLKPIPSATWGRHYRVYRIR